MYGIGLVADVSDCRELGITTLREEEKSSYSNKRCHEHKLLQFQM